MKYLSLFIGLLITSASFAQGSGFYGKRNFIEVSGKGYYPLLQRWVMDPPKGFNSNFDPAAYDHFNYGATLKYMRSSEKSFARGFELGIDFASIFPKAVLPYEGAVLESEAFDITTYSLLSKSEMAYGSGTLPMGFVHEFGLGATMTSIDKRDYTYQIIKGELTEEQLSVMTPVNYDKNYFGLTVLYGFKMRHALNKTILFNYGLRYTFNYVFKGDNQAHNNVLMSDEEQALAIRKQRISNVITLDVGFTFAF